MRYHELATVREYATERLAERPDQPVLWARLVDYYVELARRTGPLLYEAHSEPHYRLLNTEVDNLAQALEWAFGDGDPLQGCRLIGALHGFWLMEGYGPLVSPHAAAARRHLADLEPRAHAEVGTVLSGTLDSSNPQRRAEISRRALEQARQVGDPVLIAMNLCHHAKALHDADPAAFPTAQAMLQEAVAISEAENTAPGYLIMALSHIVVLAIDHGDLDQAIRAEIRHRDLSDAIGHWRGVASADLNLSSLADARGDGEEALRLGRRSLQMAWDHERHRGFISWSLPVVGYALITAGREELGAVVLAAGIEACRRNGRLDPDGKPMGFAREHHRATERLAAAVEPDRLNALQTQGQAMSMEEAVHLALGAHPTP